MNCNTTHYRANSSSVPGDPTENTNYKLTLQDGGRYILTVFEKRVAEADLPFFMELMECLAARGVPCPTPIRGKDGSAIQHLKGKPAVIVTFLEGREAACLEDGHMRELGTHMARMHLAGQGYDCERANALSVSGWQKLLAAIDSRADELAPGLACELREEMQEVSLAWPKELPRGVIHADLFPDNVFFDADGCLSGMIDFYFACTDFLAYDLVVCINAWCFERGGAFHVGRSANMLRAYHEVRPLKESEKAMLPVLARGAALRFLLTRAYDWLFPVEGAIVTPKDPLEYLPKLRFHRGVKHPEEYGL